MANCDHCSKYINDEEDINAIYWCRECIKSDIYLLEKYNVSIGYGLPHQRWAWREKSNTIKLKMIPKIKKYSLVRLKCLKK
jgi:hypothetical protein